MSADTSLIGALAALEVTRLQPNGDEPVRRGVGASSPVGPDELEKLDAWFTSLLQDDMTVDILLQKAAAVAQCPVGMQLENSIDGRTATAAGRLSTGIAPSRARSRALSAGGVVWIERLDPETNAEFDDRVLDRLQLVMTVLLRQMSAREPVLGQSALIEVAISSTADAADRARALRLLGYDPSAQIRVLAVGGRREAVEHIVDQLRSSGQRVVHAAVGTHWAVVTDGPLPPTLDVPIGARVASGPTVQALEAPRSWQLAWQTFRFTLPSSHGHGPYPPEEAVIVIADDVGCLALLARHIPVDAIGNADEVRGLDLLASEQGGLEMLRTLEVVAATESLRRAAGVMHMHHNSVRHRVERAGEVLGFNPTEPYGRVRLMMALILRRLRDAHSVSDNAN